METRTKKTLGIIYHYPCYDGAYGAINTYLYYYNFSRTIYNIKLFPLKNTQEKNPVLKGLDKAIIIDLSIEHALDTTFLLENPSIKVLWFDHHSCGIDIYNKEYKSQLDKRGNIKVIFDTKGKEAACGLTYRYYKRKAINKKIFDYLTIEQIFPKYLLSILEYVEDNDTGNFSLLHTQEFKSGLCNQFHPATAVCDFTTKNFIQKMNNFLNLDVKYTIRHGEKIYRKYKKNALNEILHKKTYLMELPNKNKDKFLVCVTENKQYRNIAACIWGRVSKQFGYSPFGGFIYSYEKGWFKVSMRTASKNSIDVGAIANELGGGGHSNAAAFTMTWSQISPLLTKTVNCYLEIIQNKEE